VFSSIIQIRTRWFSSTRLAFPRLFEGQMRIAFILDALTEAGITGAQVIVAGCSDNQRLARHRTDGNEAELANPTS
jgi:hypothetical protein